MMLNKKIVIIVEGKDEDVFFKKLCAFLSIDAQIISTDGISKFKTMLPAIINDDNFDDVEHLILIRDADLSQESAVQSLKDLLKRHNLPSPKSHAEFSRNEKISIGIFIAPGGDNGMLETLISRSFENHPVKEHANTYIESLTKNLKPQNNMASHNSPKNKHKAMLLTILAGMEESVNTIGSAIEKKYINLDSDAFSELRDFLLAPMN